LFQAATCSAAWPAVAVKPGMIFQSLAPS
jgi:hypothetical protein